MKEVKRIDNVEVKDLIKEVKKDLRLGLNAQTKSLDYYKSTCNLMLQLATISVVTKKTLLKNLNTVFEKSTLSPSYVKRVRGTITNFFEGGRKYPQKINDIEIRLQNISSFKELEMLSKNFKNRGESETPQKSKEKSPKSKNVKIKINPIDNSSIDRKKYYKMIENVIKVSSEKLDILDDDTVINIFDECIKISKLIGGVEG